MKEYWCRYACCKNAAGECENEDAAIKDARHEAMEEAAHVADIAANEVERGGSSPILSTHAAHLLRMVAAEIRGRKGKG